jgi:endonuclease-3
MISKARGFIGGLGRSTLSSNTGSVLGVCMPLEYSGTGNCSNPKRISRVARPFTKAEADEFFARLKAQNPNPRTELVYTNPYTLLVAVVLSAQATDKGVNKATGPLFLKVATPDQMVALGEAGLTQYIKTIGLYRGKAKNVIALSRMLIEQHGGKVPREREALEELPGVGRKTANVVLNVAFGEPTIAVDTHIFRVSNRTGLAPGKNPLDVEGRLEKIVPEKYKLHAHHWLILHGRYTCVARKPHCPTCVVRDLCRFKDKTVEPKTAPKKAPLRKPASRHAPAKRRGR